MSKVDFKSHLSKTLKLSDAAEQQRFAPEPAQPKRPSVAELAARVDGKLDQSPASAPRLKAKPKPVRRSKPTLDSYSCTKEDINRLQQLVTRALKVGTPTNKSEVIRAGFIALAAMGDAEFSKTLLKVPRIKTGRPPASEKT